MSNLDQGLFAAWPHHLYYLFRNLRHGFSAVTGSLPFGSMEQTQYQRQDLAMCFEKDPRLSTSDEAHVTYRSSRLLAARQWEDVPGPSTHQDHQRPNQRIA